MTPIDWLCVLLPCLTISWSVVVSSLAWLQPRWLRPVAELDGSPPISVVVPVSSPATNLQQCVESLLEADYNHLEILLVASAHDRVASNSIRNAARIGGNVRALVLEPYGSSNPKVGLLTAALDYARHGLLMFTDDNTISSAGRFRSHLERLTASYKLISAAAVGVQPLGFWGQVDAAFMNGYFARLQLAGDCVGFAGVTGKSMLVRRSDLEKAGGLLKTGASLCEDAALQKAIARIGGRTGLSRDPVTQPIGQRTLFEVWSRHRRWFFCRRTQVPWVYAAEIVTSTISTSVLGALAALALGFSWWMGLLAAPGLLLVLEISFLSIKGWPVGKLYPFVWIAREFLVLPLWIAAIWGGNVAWRSRQLPLRS